MKVEYLLTRPLVSIPSGSAVLDAAKLMAKKKVGLVVIHDRKDKTIPVGVISERDIIKSIAAGKKVSNQVDKICTKKIVTLKASLDVAEVAKAMNQHRIRHVVVVDDEGRLKGVVSMRDLVGERAALRSIVQSQEKDIFAGGD